MSRLSRTSSASSESYTTLPPSLESHHHHHQQSGMPSYYHHGRVGSLSGPGVASSNGAVGYYDQIPEGVSSSPAGTLGSNAMAAVASYQQQEPFAVGPPLTLGGNLPASVVTSNGRRLSKSGRSVSASGAYSVQPPSSGGRASSGAWSPQDDDALLQARARGENWSQIQIQFPGKTPNACRKRHERLMERRNAGNDFDARKMEQLAREYMHLRREMWQPLAQRTGEKWTVVEQKCMNAGLKNLQGVSRSSSRRLRIEQGYVGVGGLPAYADESDLLGPSMVVGSNGHAHLVAGGGSGDDLLDGHGSPGGSTNSNVGGGNRSVSGGSNSSTVSVQTTHHMGAPSRRHAHSHSHSYSHLQVPSSAGSPGAGPQPDVGSPGGTYPDYYATTTGFSQSLRGMDGAGAGNGAVPSSNGGASMVSPYMGHPHQHHQQHHGHPAQQQAHHGHRLLPDMGIDALLHRR